MNRTSQIDRPMFITTLIVILAVTFPIVAFNQNASNFITSLYNNITSHFGWMYQWYALLALLFLVWLAFSKYGQVKLAYPQDD